MSWDDRLMRPGRPLRIATLGLALCLGGCLQPLYGPAAGGRPGVAAELATIEVDDIPDRLGFELRNELNFLLNGEGRPTGGAYRLRINVRQGTATAIVDTLTGRAQSATLNFDATYALLRTDGGKEVTAGRALTTVNYDRTAQRFGNVRAARDAEIRAAKQLAEQIRMRLAIFFADRR